MIVSIKGIGKENNDISSFSFFFCDFSNFIIIDDVGKTTTYWQQYCHQLKAIVSHSDLKNVQSWSKLKRILYVLGQWGKRNLTYFRKRKNPFSGYQTPTLEADIFQKVQSCALRILESGLFLLLESTNPNLGALRD